MRLDRYLFENGMTESRQKAVYCIKEGLVHVDGRTVIKPSFDVKENTVELLKQSLPFVGRGGLKLQGAFEVFDLQANGKVCLDLGASTGGFTDCLLQYGAKKVYALDVGHGQLHEKIKSDLRVVPIEGFNARDLSESTFEEKIELAVSDLSFISQRLIYLPLSKTLANGAQFLSLIKPQFEVGRAALGKNGIVKDKKEHIKVIEELMIEAKKCNFFLADLVSSPIEGGDGNKEYLALFYFKNDVLFDREKISKAVYGETGGGK